MTVDFMAEEGLNTPLELEAFVDNWGLNYGLNASQKKDICIFDSPKSLNPKHSLKSTKRLSLKDHDPDSLYIQQYEVPLTENLNTFIKEGEKKIGAKRRNRTRSDRVTNDNTLGALGIQGNVWGESAEFQQRRFLGDLYTPSWIRGRGNSREGLCSLCNPPVWFRMKQSAYW